MAYTINNILLGRMRTFPETMSPGCRNLITGLTRARPQERTTLVVREDGGGHRAHAGTATGEDHTGGEG